MLTVDTRYAVDPETAKGFDTAGLRRNFQVAGLFLPGEIRLTYAHYDRLILGGAVPNGQELTLDHVKECGTDSILERREMAVLNIGAPGTVAVGGESHALDKGEVLYIGRGAGPVTFAGDGRFYILSAPAHSTFPTRRITIDEANRVDLGAAKTANERTIYQFVHPEVMESCQLVMGYTMFHGGSVWNTMPCHVHDRRMEAYLYFDVDPAQRVFHFMGKPEETRHLVIQNEEAVISPPWSIHCGAGTGRYSFCWAMAGDNVDFRDMDMVGMEELR
ncbi:5-dehydro-4-deoxy-D-glucuronate isomerase [Sulfitobacter sp. D35]|uniref:5-dehydro-4-deoxy-D-glucuronate isomerase n=1 Tax=Sulfitobacter sp. D35 TaxID=3083252 RepID=UPI00296E858A|nr:5-dehydro-4-deoxy-D-glucuronate isomerase [Sulfitobacter sp. D35]MDW4499673.1 5-dehydro-4-deoxy-D-glucuronate isomerase [Sulfitobacter sp. D35]